MISPSYHSVRNGFALHNRICLCSRQFSLNSVLDQSFNASREAKMMNKLLGSNKKKRKLYFDSPVATTTKGPKLGLPSNKENSRRIAVLNSLFMKHVSELLMNGDSASEVVDKNFEISRVAMAPTFDHVNVYWATNSEENAAALEEALPRVGFSLRHELSQLRVMGVVPRIYFVRDKQLLSALRVDHLLSIADYGEDHTPLSLGSEFKNGTVTEKTVVLKKEESSDEEEVSNADEETIVDSETMPMMRHDIFNLDHKKVMDKIIKLVHKSRALHRFQPNLALECEGVTTPPSLQPEDNMTANDRKALMAQFILSRKILIEKRAQNKYNAELNVPRDYEGTGHEDDDDDCDHLRNEDYIDENIFYEKDYR